LFQDSEFTETGDARTGLAIEGKALMEKLRAVLGEGCHAETRHRSCMQFSPSISYGRHFGPPQPTARQAAVMILIELRDGQWTIPLTERPQHLPDHPGQISLPGGRLEAHETHLEAAMREFNEELGTERFPGEVIGELSPIYVYNSDYYVRPFLAVCAHPIQYLPCPQEVARVIQLPVSHLLADGLYVQQTFRRGMAAWTARTIHIEGAQVWGATAIILGECARVLELAGQ
jgi:8-oxo-dGTP pyrophosphatase MutT (NUDIX family)